MQATATTRQFDPRKIKQAAMAVGLLTSMAIGTLTITIVRDASDPTDSAAIQSRSVPMVHEQGGYLFREQNLELPAAGDIQATNDSVDYAFMEQNLYLPGDTTQAAPTSFDAIRFREMNELPISIAPAAPNWRIIELNSWGENFNFASPNADGLAPTPDDVPQQLRGQVSY